LKHIHSWVATGFSRKMLQEPEVHLANAELSDSKRGNRLTRWATDKNAWQAWFLKSIIDEWEEEDKSSHGRISIIKQFIQKLVNLAWRFFPWFVLGEFYWRMESLYYLVVMLSCIIFIWSIDARYTSQNEHFTIWKATLFLCVPPTIVFYIYGQIHMADLVVSTILHIMVFFILCDWTLGLYNIWIKFSIKGKSDMELTRELLVPRLLVPRALISLQRIWPYFSMILLAIIGLLTVMVSGGLTTLLFNGRVADMWHRAYLQKS